MESIPRAKYISKRAKIILLIKENKKIEVKEELLRLVKNTLMTTGFMISYQEYML